MNLEFLFDREANAKERLAFVRTCAPWVEKDAKCRVEPAAGRVDRQFFNNTRNMPLSPRDYLLVVADRKNITARTESHCP